MGDYNGKWVIIYFSREGNNYVNGSIKNLVVGNTGVAANEWCEPICDEEYLKLK